ncbi:MAG: hypothetical protein H6978_15145 [Gammaproteobacteria bacterium]|nr:hypothetical protein [Gammaproteobacteria bacterium]
MRLQIIVASFGLAVAAAAHGANSGTPAVGDYVSFQDCPIARDTGPETDLCFFTEHDGVRYGLIEAQDFGRPQLKHRLLVEGQVVDGPLVCGGIPLQGRFSVLTELDDSCNRIVPFDGNVVGVASGVFNRGSPEQRAAAMAMMERSVSEPAVSLLPAIPESPALAEPRPPFETRNFTLYYPYNSDRGSGPDMMEIVRLVHYARAARATVTLTPFRGSSLLDDGTRLAEKPDIAQQRGEKLKGIMAGLGLDEKSIIIGPPQLLIEGDGHEDWKNRRIEVELVPRRR